ncbi:MAG: recombinase family protein [Bosea sp.]|nr:recombinase family protein [Bosea sp. (in: a-proteobacteria)]
MYRSGRCVRTTGENAGPASAPAYAARASRGRTSCAPYVVRDFGGRLAGQLAGGGAHDGSPTVMDGGRLVFHIFGSLAEFERGVIRERTKAGLSAARARGRVGGRPVKLTGDDLKAAKALLGDPTITVADVAKRLGVSPATLYRHLPAARSTMQETEGD